jgi:hypothetical protein
MGRHNIKTAVVLCCGGIALVSRLVWNVLSQPTMSAAYKRTVRLHSIQYKVAFRYRPSQRFRTAGKCCYLLKLIQNRMDTIDGKWLSSEILWIFYVGSLGFILGWALSGFGNVRAVKGGKKDQ